MRLSADQVKHAILHDDKDVRDAAAYYFSRSFSTDPGIMPLAIQAIEQHGWDNAFQIYSFMKDLIQTEATVRWLIEQVKKHGEPDEEYGFRHALRSALVHANAAILEEHQSEILNLDGLDDERKKTISERIAFQSQPADHLWHDLEAFCQHSDKLDTVPDDLDVAENRVEALGRHPEFSIPKVLTILTGLPANNWMELFAVRLAGELRLQEAIPPIVALYEEPDDWIFEDGHRALAKIGGDRVAEEFARAYPEGSADLRSSAASILENIHTDLSVETCLRLFENEQDHPTQCSLLQSMLMSFSTEGIEPARQFILRTSLDPEVLEVRHDLLVACKMIGAMFPEFDAWTEDAKNDVEFRKAWYRKYALPSLNEFELNDEEDDELGPPPDTIIREARVGRNDPCPCGSGKKFKKCCLQKGSAAI